MNVMLGTSSGWLHQRLREGENDYVYAVGARTYRGDRAGHYWIQTDFTPADEAKVLEIIDGVVADMRAGRFTDQELEIARRSILCYDTLGKRENENVCSGDALSELLGKGWDHDAVYFAGIKAVTREDVVRVANLVLSRPSVRVLVRPVAPR
jgi:predicted Zn-dependent peptidase